MSLNCLRCPEGDGNHSACYCAERQAEQCFWCFACWKLVPHHLNAGICDGGISPTFLLTPRSIERAQETLQKVSQTFRLVTWDMFWQIKFSLHASISHRAVATVGRRRGTPFTGHPFCYSFESSMNP